MSNRRQAITRTKDNPCFTRPYGATKPHWVKEEHCDVNETCLHGLLTKYPKLRVAHAPGMPGTFYRPPRVSDPNMDHCTCVTHVPWCVPGSLTSGFIWSRWRGKHSRRMRNAWFCVSGKRPMLAMLRWLGWYPINLVQVTATRFKSSRPTGAYICVSKGCRHLFR